MTAIVAVDQNWGIGNGNRLLFRIPADQRFFRETTTGGVVVMGRKTFESFPKQQPLPNRVNIVLSRDPSFHPEGVIVANKEGDLDRVLEQHVGKKVFLIGGAQIYHAFLGRCEEALVTKVEAVRDADTFFPDLDADPDWILKETGSPMEHEGVVFSFCRYVRR